MKGHLYEGGANLPFIVIEPDGFAVERAYPLVVLLHGFGANMYDLAGLSPTISTGGYVFAYPNAPFAVDLGGGGAVGYSWSRNRPGIVAPEPAEAEPTAEERLDATIQEIVDLTGAQPGRVVLGGFSQGGGLTLRFGLLRPEMFTGLAVLSGSFQGAEELVEQLPAQKTQPVFVAHGLYDPMIGIERGRATRSFLDDVGYVTEYHEYPMAHEISEEVLRDLKEWLERVLPPLGPGA
jgi:phospholipase/carboxylesterase